MYPTRTSSVYLAFVTFKDARILLRKLAGNIKTDSYSFLDGQYILFNRLHSMIFMLGTRGEKSDVAKLNSLNFACAHA